MREDDKEFALKTSEGNDDQEFIVIRLSQFQIPINVVNIYGEQECRSSKEKIKDNWTKILEVLKRVIRLRHFKAKVGVV